MAGAFAGMFSKDFLSVNKAALTNPRVTIVIKNSLAYFKRWIFGKMG